MKHYDEQELILFHYGEAPGDEIERHLEACPSCREESERLRRLLGALDDFPVPERPAAYPAQVWARVQDRATRPRGLDWRAWFRVPRLALAGGMAVLLMAAFFLGQLSRAPELAQPVSEQVRERIMLVAVGDHLERSQRMLIELVHTEGNGEIDIAEQQSRARNLVSNNRLYRQTAAQAGDETVAELLEELERLLVEIANGPSQLARNELADLQRRIERKGLLFKIRVIGDDARQKADVPAKRGPRA